MGKWAKSQIKMEVACLLGKGVPHKNISLYYPDFKPGLSKDITEKPCNGKTVKNDRKDHRK